MEKGKAEVNSNNSMDRISELPEEILQIILYFLSQKEAVRTSVLSKSWRNIWCTRPNLDFSDDTFKGNKQQFLSVVDTTLRRYCDQRLRVEEFNLRILLGVFDHKYVSLLEKWIRTLAFMGTKKLRLSNRSKHRSGIFVDLLSVVFEAESLQDLHVERFMLDRNDAVKRIVVFKHLRSLCLEQVCIEDDVFETIISNCPLIETLDVKECRSLRTIKVNHLRNLKKFCFSKHRVDCSIEIHPPSLVTVDISDNIWLHDGGGYFRNLNILRLWCVKSSLEHLSSCKFPCLERLTIFHCDGMMGIKLFVDAPKINNFTYAGGDFIPSISFATTTSREWRSFIYICLRDDSSSWLPELNELLKSLSWSKISLNIVKKNFNRPAVRGNGCNEPVAVEIFNLRCRVSCLSSILTDVFCICRPRIIGSDFAGKHDKDVTECMWKILMRRESGGDKDDELAQLLLRDLEEVRLEAKREGKWRPMFVLPSYEQRKRFPIRFALKWRQTVLSTS